MGKIEQGGSIFGEYFGVGEVQVWDEAYSFGG